VRILFLNDLSDPRIGSSVRQMYEHGGELRTEPRLAAALRLEQQVCEPRVHRQARERSTVGGDALRIVQCPETAQQVSRAVEHRRGRGIQPGQVSGIVHSPGSEFQGQRRQVVLFPAGCMPCGDVDAVGVCLSQLHLERPRQWGVCWLALQLWQQLELDNFWQLRLPPSREGTPWLKVLKTLVVYRLIDPGSEWRLHRQWFDASAMADLLEYDLGLAEKNTLYRCLDKLVEHKDDLFKFLVRRWGELFGAKFDVLLYDLTSTYFETDEDRGSDDLRFHSRVGGHAVGLA
jgi:hypothetical protein